ncbi:NAD-dependent succinate-semialdehyde dehydrogenase [Pseudonocardia sulfidoxydans NBRC 16205]|uniref:NAD-dependent succinate-semialdehyde dehydrogenase n=1 Tax=Pseudonocardia sulfidoxydans NBRC 16205 TaxID=1223511 RepID=A0A511DV12_9PSEU|nr:NAD-dependent succinate-semialdehyde dehydrogenase [Pseudonocardia sulfidoxydans]GEL26938.1 NAD-dependent succinate-semialdehyde dehydrogenase [Pseudonocardia sulfidoxydans NBRC 16205]
MTALGAAAVATHVPYIAGRWVDGIAGEVAVVDPATGEPLATVRLSDTAQCLGAVDAAAAQLDAWSATAPARRGEILRRAYELMVERAEELAVLIVRENGKTIHDARGEVAYAAEFFRWFAHGADRVRGDMRRSPGGTNWIMVSHQPVGVALLITPWNFPAAMVTRKLAPALAAGCTVVVKPSLETPLTTFALVEILAEAGVPPGVVNVVTPDPPGEAVAAMLADRRVRALSFTGSTEVGRVLLRAAADNVIRSSLELGGNAPFLVLDDADLGEAVAGLLVAKLRNGGAACTAANRVLLQAGIADEFTALFTEQLLRTTVGNGLDESTRLGPMVSAVELDRVTGYVRAAADEGARVVVGSAGPGGAGHFHPATLLTGLDPDSALLRREIFGPVAPVLTFVTVDDGVRLANATDAGLVGYVYSGSLERALGVARRLESGMVGVNRGVVSDPGAPFGGVKHSGLGREGSEEGIHEFLETKYVAVPYH